ncbi:alpha-L-glutamate ligase-like protein [Wenzhouxiangella sp. AB-CW3]|nr:alpha-L-glutamate ligase-like protein [Wenzhouxiangella sp. AB-CW3]
MGLVRKLRQSGVLGLNARNARYVLQHNPRHLYPLVDDKVLCKARLKAHGIAVPEQLGVVRGQYQARLLAQRLEQLDAFAIKPATGTGGDGVLVTLGRRGSDWLGPGGSLLSIADIQYHVSGILAGMYSLGGQLDSALIEALVRTDPVLRPIAPEGVPDIRVIVFRGVPVMAMVRLPTRRSGGKANLHQGAIGAGIDMATGQTLSAVMHHDIVNEHPDTGIPITGFQMPGWEGLIRLSARCFDAVPLGYLGVDIVLDEHHGPLVLELNARPGLAIQIANRAGLQHRLAFVDRLENPEGLGVQARARYALEGMLPR